jgi:hypothetical protein
MALAVDTDDNDAIFAPDADSDDDGPLVAAVELV